MTDLPCRYDVTITVDRDGDHPNPAEFAVAAGQAASARAVSIVSAHTASQIVSIVTVLAADQPAAVAVALDVASMCSSVRLRHPSADRTAVADLMRRLVEPGVPVILGAARPAPQRQVAMPRPWLPASRADAQMHGIQEIFCGMPGASECPYGHRSGWFANSGTGIR